MLKSLRLINRPPRSSIPLSRNLDQWWMRHPKKGVADHFYRTRRTPVRVVRW